MRAQGGPGGRLLVVDDDEMNRDMLSRRLQRKGFEIAVAADGREALAALAPGQPAFDLVLLDIMMPGIDGLQVLERLREKHSAVQLPVIMATAKDTSDDVVRALRLGANDYVTKPLDFDVVLARVRTHLSLKLATAELQAAHRRMKGDLEAAARLQRALMPAQPPEIAGVRFAWRYLPCDELAGDILDVFALNERWLGMYLLDVSGHGVPAALLSVTLSRVLSALDESALLLETGPGQERRPRSPAQVAERLNERFPMDASTRQYFTIAYALLDPARRTLRYVAAAHPGPLRVRADGTAEINAPAGLAIGWFPHARYQEHELPLTAGDRLYFYSDGLVEAEDAAGEQFGSERIAATLAARSGAQLDDTLDLLLAELAAWCGDAGPRDDVSLLALELTATD